jgi:hypothetical protein
VNAKTLVASTFFYLSGSAVAVTPIDIPPSPTGSVTIDTRHEAARVVSCAVEFPLDSVQFSEQQVTACMNAANLDHVSYIHVIATATSTGSGTHNLYLSTRRAGAIEAFLNNRYPNIQVHAFGGGINPKFGKMARIFVVENQKKGDEISPGIQVASAGPPEVIERTTTKYVTQMEYRDRPKHNIDVAMDTGFANTSFSPDVYDYLSVNIKKTVRTRLTGVISTGMRHRMLTSNDVIDINTTSVMIGRDWNVFQLWGLRVKYEQLIEAGQLIANGRSLEWGTTGTLSVSNNDLKLALIGSKSNFLSSLGIGIGVKL